MKTMKKILVLCLCAMLITAPVFTEAVSAAVKITTVSPKKGWYKLKSGKMRYYKNGKYLTGCQKIGKNVYLFSKYGTMIKKNKTYKGIFYYVDSKGYVQGWKKGASYYDKNGKRMEKYKAQDFCAYQNARSVVDRVTNRKMSKSQKLQACFRWVMSKYYRTWRRFDQGGKAWYAVQANDHFERGCGDCIADASAFAYLAKVLGYKNVYICADAPRSNNSAHAWTEINGRVYDPLFAEAKSFSRNYNVSYSTYGWIGRPKLKQKIA